MSTQLHFLGHVDVKGVFVYGVHDVEIRKEAPAGVRYAYDGLEIDLPQ